MVLCAEGVSSSKDELRGTDSLSRAAQEKAPISKISPFGIIFLYLQQVEMKSIPDAFEAVRYVGSVPQVQDR